MIARWVLAILLGASATAGAQEGSTGSMNPACPDAQVFSGLFTDLCWGCFFPIRIAGAPMGGSPINVPDDAAAPVCVCPSERFFGYPTTGYTVGMWQPTHLIETVRTAMCMPSMGGISYGQAGAAGGIANLGRQGGPGDESTRDEPLSTYHFHWYAFPVGMLTNAIADSVCTGNNGYDMDLLYMSEIDPLMNNDELAMFLHPEATIFASPPAIAACLVDAAAATIGKPIDALFYCAGTWGHIYPHTGNTQVTDSGPREMSLVATKGLSAMHRRGLAKKSGGDSAVCADHPIPTLPKQQYKLQMMYPIAERITNHWIGQSSFTWGEHRTIPAVGEDGVWIQWSWQDCCVNP